MNLYAVLKVGRSGFGYTASGIVFVPVLGLIPRKMLRMQGNSSYLITSGTAICQPETCKTQFAEIRDLGDRFLLNQLVYPQFCRVVDRLEEEDVGCPRSPIRPTAPIDLLRLSWSLGLTGAILPCSYRLSFANCGTAVVSYYRKRLSFRKDRARRKPESR